MPTKKAYTTYDVKKIIIIRVPTSFARRTDAGVIISTTYADILIEMSLQLSNVGIKIIYRKVSEL